MDSTVRPFFLQPPLQALPLHSYPPQLTPNCGLVQPSAMAPPPHLYHLHCNVAGSQPLQRAPRDGSVVLTAPLPSVYNDAPQTEIIFCNSLHDSFAPVAKCPPSFHAVSGLPFAAPAAGSTPLVSNHACLSHSTVASTSIASNSISSPWKMSSPAVFSAPVLPTQSPSTTVQPVPRFLQPQFFPDVAQEPVKFTSGLLPDCSGLVKVAARNIGNENGSGDEPMGKRFVPCWHSAAANTVPTSTFSAAPLTDKASICLSTSTAVPIPASAANMFSPTKSDKQLVASTSPAAASSVCAVGNCRHDVCDNYVDDDDDDEDDDDESVSDESSSTSNQKDNGKYCECWRCEFFGHADVRLSFSVR